MAKAKRPKPKRKALSLAEVKALGLKSENQTAAAAAFSGPGDLDTQIARRPKVKAAWERGRFLRDLDAQAAMLCTVTQAAKKLGMGGLELRALLDTDAEAADLWDSRRQKIEGRCRAAILVAAEQGKPNALRYVQTFLRSEQTADGGFDYEHVPGKVIEAITGKSRQTLYNWHIDGHMPRNADGTTNLAEFFRWFEKAAIDKRRTGPEKLDPMREVKTQLQQVELKQRLGGLLERTAVENGLATRMQNFLAAIANHLPAAAGHCVEAAGDVERIEAHLHTFVEKIRVHLCDVPPELQLAGETRTAFARLLGRMTPADVPPADEKGK